MQIHISKKAALLRKKGRIWVIHISGQYSYKYISVRKPLFYVKVRKPCIIYENRFFTNIYLQKCSIFTWKGSFLWSCFLQQKQNDSYSSFITNLPSACEVRSYCGNCFTKSTHTVFRLFASERSSSKSDVLCSNPQNIGEKS